MEGLTLQPFDFEAITLGRGGAVTRRERLSAQQLIQELGPDIVLEMVAIPAGAFLMGSPEGHGYDGERPQHRVAPLGGVPPCGVGRGCVPARPASCDAGAVGRGDGRGAVGPLPGAQAPSR